MLHRPSELSAAAGLIFHSDQPGLIGAAAEERVGTIPSLGCVDDAMYFLQLGVVGGWMVSFLLILKVLTELLRSYCYLPT